MADAPNLNTGRERDNAIADAINAALEVMNTSGRRCRGCAPRSDASGVDLSSGLPLPNPEALPSH
jgi:hypothetical protein